MQTRRNSVTRVRVLVEVELGPWEEGCSMKQVVDAGFREGPDKVRNALKTNGGIRVIEAVAVSVISTEQK